MQKMIYEDSLKSSEYKREIQELKNSDKKIEQVAREKYKMTKPGERIFRIKTDTIK
jgi:cell division protein FtsB